MTVDRYSLSVRFRTWIRVNHQPSTLHLYLPMYFSLEKSAGDDANKPSRKKPIFPVNDLLRDYLKQHGREVKLPVSYNDLRLIAYAVPLKDKNGQDTLVGNSFLRYAALAIHPGRAGENVCDPENRRRS